MFAIGDFSRLARVTVKALRLYDEMGLLAPARVDSATGYRYYSAAQLPRLNRILVLKELGFSLESIRQLLHRPLPAAELRGMLHLRREEQAAAVGAERLRLQNLDRWIADLEREDERGTILEILLKKTNPSWLLSVTDRIPSYTSVGMLYPEVYQFLGPKSAGVIPVAIWHDVEYKESDVLAEAGVIVEGEMPVSGRLQIRQLEVVEAACYVYRGSYQGLKGAYDRLSRWIEERNLKIDGPPRELYLYCGYPVRQDDETYVTELQIPVREIE